MFAVCLKIIFNTYVYKSKMIVYNNSIENLLEIQNLNAGFKPENKYTLKKKISNESLCFLCFLSLNEQ